MFHILIAVGLVAGLLLGLAAAATGSGALMAFATGVEPLGTVPSALRGGTSMSPWLR